MGNLIWSGENFLDTAVVQGSSYAGNLTDQNVKIFDPRYLWRFGENTDLGGPLVSPSNYQLLTLFRDKVPVNLVVMAGHTLPQTEKISHDLYGANLLVDSLINQPAYWYVNGISGNTDKFLTGGGIRWTSDASMEFHYYNGSNHNITLEENKRYRVVVKVTHGAGGGDFAIKVTGGTLYDADDWFNSSTKTALTTPFIGCTPSGSTAYSGLWVQEFVIPSGTELSNPYEFKVENSGGAVTIDILGVYLGTVTQSIAEHDIGANLLKIGESPWGSFRLDSLVDALEWAKIPKVYYLQIPEAPVSGMVVTKFPNATADIARMGYFDAFTFPDNPQIGAEWGTKTTRKSKRNSNTGTVRLRAGGQYDTLKLNLANLSTTEWSRLKMMSGRANQDHFTFLFPDDQVISQRHFMHGIFERFPAFRFNDIDEASTEFNLVGVGGYHV